MILLRHGLPCDLLTPLGVYMALRATGASVLLESANREGTADTVGRHSFVLIRSGATREVRLPPPGAGWVEALRALAGAPIDETLEDPESELLGTVPLPVGVGCCGYVGFEAFGALEPTVPMPAKDTLGVPGVWVRRFESALVFDHLHQIAEFQLLVADRAAVSRGFEQLRRLAASLALPHRPLDVPSAPKRAVPLIDRTTYEAYVRRSQEHIHDGDVYQIVPSQRFRVDDPPPPTVAYRRLRRLNPSPYSVLLEWEDFALVTASPESLVRVLGNGEAETMPIAGTTARGQTPEEDAVRFAELRDDPKERAEHQMLVDLARNDLGRVAVIGGVRVERPLTVQRTSHVLHMVTTVKARLKAGLDALDVLASVFPAGTVSGAPKVRACQLLAAIEGEVRGPYGGVLVRLGADGKLDNALILRTAVYTRGAAFVQAGAGVVRRSQPASEYMETLQKARATLEALGAITVYPQDDNDAARGAHPTASADEGTST